MPKPAKVPISRIDPSLFLNVDLEIYSRSDLAPLVATLGRKVIDLYVGRVRRTYEAHLELARYRQSSPTALILGLCKLIEGLPATERALWDSAKTRSFDIGIEAPRRGSHYWAPVSSEAVDAAARLGARIAITVYGPMKVMGATKVRSRQKK